MRNHKKISHRIKYSGLDSNVETWKFECNTKIDNYTKKSDKIIKKKVKYYSHRERLEKLGLTTLQERRMRGDLIEAFKIINEISNYNRHFFNISLRTGNIMSRQISIR